MGCARQKDANYTKITFKVGRRNKNVGWLEWFEFKRSST